MPHPPRLPDAAQHPRGRQRCIRRAHAREDTRSHPDAQAHSHLREAGAGTAWCNRTARTSRQTPRTSLKGGYRCTRGPNITQAMLYPTITMEVYGRGGAACQVHGPAANVQQDCRTPRRASVSSDPVLSRIKREMLSNAPGMIPRSMLFTRFTRENTHNSCHGVHVARRLTRDIRDEQWLNRLRDSLLGCRCEQARRRRAEAVSEDRQPSRAAQ